MRILVTGGAGFIGSHTCVLLLEKGYKLIIVDSFINSPKQVIERIKKLASLKSNFSYEDIEVKVCDIRDFQSLNQIFLEASSTGNPIDSVLHFAGLKSVSESLKNPILYWDVNVGGSINLLKVMNKNNCRTIIFSSSATIYGQKVRERITESCEIKPINPYGVTKMTIEKLMNDCFSESNSKWRIANLRYFNPIGAHSSGFIGENPKGKPDNLFPFIIKVASKEYDELKIFGNDWETHDGTGIRDYIHVVDLAEGHIKTLEYLKTQESLVLNMNLGTSRGTSVLDLVNTFQEVNKIKIKYKFVDRRNGDVAKSVADNQLLKKTLNWVPNRSLKDMCIDGWKWNLLNPNGYL